MSRESSNNSILKKSSPAKTANKPKYVPTNPETMLNAQSPSRLATPMTGVYRNLNSTIKPQLQAVNNSSQNESIVDALIDRMHLPVTTSSMEGLFEPNSEKLHFNNY